MGRRITNLRVLSDESVSVFCGSFGCVHMTPKGTIHKYFVDPNVAKDEAKTNQTLMRIMPEYYKYTLLATSSSKVHKATRVPQEIIAEFAEDSEFFVIQYLRGRGNAFDYMENTSLLSSCELVHSMLHLHTNFIKVMHARGIWHLDIKLENLVLTTDRTRLIDFGNAETYSEGKDFPNYNGLVHNMSPLTILATVAFLSEDDSHIRADNVKALLTSVWGEDM
eukprot:gene19543-26225_t